MPSMGLCDRPPARWQGTQLVEQTEGIRLAPALDALIAREAQGTNSGQYEGLSGRRHALKRSGMRAFYDETARDPVTGGKQVFEGESRPGKSGPAALVVLPDAGDSRLNTSVAVKHAVGTGAPVNRGFQGASLLAQPMSVRPSAAR